MCVEQKQFYLAPKVASAQANKFNLQAFNRKVGGKLTHKATRITEAKLDCNAAAAAHIILYNNLFKKLAHH